MEFQYTIAGKNYTQKPLVFGQLRQLEAVVSGLGLSADMNINDLVRKLISGGALGKAIAIVLTPEGIKLKDKKIDALIEEIEFDLELDTTVKVIEDFFTCNPIHSLTEKIGQAGERIKAKAAEQMKSTTPTALSPSLPQETSPRETTSCGDSDQPTAANT